MYDDGEIVKIVLIALLLVGVVCVDVFFNWQAYVQAIEAVGGEPSVAAFIGWIL